MTARATQPLQLSVWKNLSITKRRFVQAMIITAIVQFVLVDIYFRLQELTQINQYLAGNTAVGFPQDGILYLPLVLSLLVYAILIAASVVLMTSASRKGAGLVAILLGSAWVLASIPLVFDFLIDSFELKLPVAFLFVYAGLRY